MVLPMPQSSDSNVLFVFIIQWKKMNSNTVIRFCPPLSIFTLRYLMRFDFPGSFGLCLSKSY